MAPKALLFDLNGTMIDDMEYHVKAWYQILNEELNAGLSWEEVKGHMYGKNEELLVRVFGKDRFNREETDRITEVKERKYQEAFRPHLALIAGLPAFLGLAKRHGIKMAIGSAAIPLNIDFVLDNLPIRHYFPVIVSAHDVIFSKPDPETYIKAAQLLAVRPADCMVFEDAPKGVEAALRAGMPCIVLTTMHNAQEFSGYPNVSAIIRDYTDPILNKLFT